jgi:hypothetical protein
MTTTAAAEGIDIECGQENLKRILGPQEIADSQRAPGDPKAANAAMPAKKPRSDKGSKRPAKPEPARAGTIDRLNAAIYAFLDAERELWAAQDKSKAASQLVNSIIDEIKHAQ